MGRRAAGVAGGVTWKPSVLMRVRLLDMPGNSDRDTRTIIAEAANGAWGAVNAGPSFCCYSFRGTADVVSVLAGVTD